MSTEKKEKHLRREAFFYWRIGKLAEVGVSHSCASHKQVSSHNLQVSSKSQVTVVRIKQVTSQVIAQVKQVTSQVIQKSDDLTQFPHLKIGKESGS